MTAQLFETIFIKVGVQTLIHPFHPVQIRPGEKVQLIRHIGDAPLYSRIIPHRLTVNENFAGIRLVYAGERTQERRLSGAVRTDHAIDAARTDGTGDILQRRKIMKALGQVFDFDHTHSPPFCCSFAAVNACSTQAVISSFVTPAIVSAVSISVRSFIFSRPFSNRFCFASAQT